MKILNTKTNVNKKILSALIILSMIATLMLILVPTAKAEIVPGTTGGSPDTQTVWSTTIPAGQTAFCTINPIAYLSFEPNPVGIGQTILVNFWTTSPSAANRYLAGLTVTFQKPDGTTDVVGPLHSYVADGTCWFEYVVDQVGTWKIKFDFPGQYFPAGKYINGINDNTTTATSANNYPSEYYTAASTDWQELTVQNEQVMSWYSPLPIDYWTRPISLNNREWYAIAGNYPWMGQSMGSSMNGAARYLGPYITSSNTAHIVWKQQSAFPAGIIGGEAGQYGNKGTATTPSVIFEGRAYATQTVQWYNGSYLSCATCYDLRTGQMYYMIPTAAPFYGMTPTFINYVMGTSTAVPGGGEDQTMTASLRLLSGSQLYTINPQTGAITSNITCMSGLYHNGWVLSPQNLGTTSNPIWRIINWTTAGTSTNFTTRITSNISSVFNVGLLTAGYITTAYPQTNLDITNATLMNEPYYSSYQADLDTGICIMQGRFTNGNVNGGILRAWSLITGQSLWNDSLTVTPFNSGTCVADDGIYFCVMEQGIIQGYDEYTGKLLWTTQTDYPWGEFWGYVQASAYGMFYAFGYTGVYAFNWTTGAIVWHFAESAPAYETPYTYNGTSVYSFTGSPIIADGKLYIDNSEHTPSTPYTRGWGFYCINATTGALIWKVNEPMVPGAMADGYTTASDGYAGYMYIFGKGQSATTIQTPLTAITSGQRVVITGSVTDLSAAQPGTPCVSEESMGAYMSYLHLQSQLPSTVTGVPVSIDTVDPNGNTVHIATVTSDMSGTFGYAWTPTIPGMYKITGTFMGSPAYGSSWAQTYATVIEAPVVTPAPTQTPVTMPPFEMYTVGTGIAVIIAVAIVGLLLLRKRP